MPDLVSLNLVQAREGRGVVEDSGIEREPVYHVDLASWQSSVIERSGFWK